MTRLAPRYSFHLYAPLPSSSIANGQIIHSSVWVTLACFNQLIILFLVGLQARGSPYRRQRIQCLLHQPLCERSLPHGISLHSFGKGSPCVTFNSLHP